MNTTKTKQDDYYSQKEVCKRCLDELSILLSKHGASWKTVKQITAYLVSTTTSSSSSESSESSSLPTTTSTIEPQLFRSVLKGYLHADNNSTKNKVDNHTDNNPPIISIRFVQRLENEYDIIEIEAVAATTKTTTMKPRELWYPHIPTSLFHNLLLLLLLVLLSSHVVCRGSSPEDDRGS